MGIKKKNKSSSKNLFINDPYTVKDLIQDFFVP